MRDDLERKMWRKRELEKGNIGWKVGGWWVDLWMKSGGKKVQREEGKERSEKKMMSARQT